MTLRSKPRTLENALELLPSPLRPLHGKNSNALSVPDNIICFRRANAAELNKPQRGRALHHRHVLIVALKTAVTVCVDDRTLRLAPEEGLLVLPFQFHDYEAPESPDLNWLFITFEHASGEALQELRYRPFKLTDDLRRLLTEVVESYLTAGAGDVTALLLALVLARIIQSNPSRRRNHASGGAGGLLSRVNQLALRPGELPGVKELARSIGISSSHLRSRFRASCGVSLGRHLRRLRLEKACGLLRMSQSRVSEVGELCGFSSIYSFSRAFRQEYGISPLSYRHGDKPKRGRKDQVSA